MQLLPSVIEDKTFTIVRRGYDREEVHRFLGRVGLQMSGSSEEARASSIRADQLEAEILEVRRSADQVIAACYEARSQPAGQAEADERTPVAERGTATVPPPPPCPMSDQPVSIEAMQILAKAHKDEAAADAVLQGALAACGRVETEAEDILAAARAEAHQIRAEAERDRERARGEAAQSAAELRRSLEDEQRDLLRRVRQLKGHLAGLEDQKTRQQAAAAAVPRQLPAAEPAGTHVAPPVQPLEPRPDWGKGATPDDVAVAIDVSVSGDRDQNIAIDLSGAAHPVHSEPELEPVPAAAKPSRYKTRSANLPRIGEAASSVLGDMHSLRRSE